MPVVGKYRRALSNRQYRGFGERELVAEAMIKCRTRFLTAADTKSVAMVRPRDASLAATPSLVSSEAHEALSAQMRSPMDERNAKTEDGAP